MYIPKLSACIKYFIRDHNLLQEILQDVFLNIWERREMINEDLSFQAYLFTSAKNKVFSVLRSKIREAERMKKLNLRLFENTTEEAVLFNDLRELQDRVINEMPGRQKEIFHLSRFKGVSNEKIALQLNISQRTVEHQLYKALKQLKKIMHSEHFLLFGLFFFQL
jgi:RNA polymerase sigma-70 factor (ECF subfamily)